MIVFKYLSRQILQTAAVVTSVLLFVVLTGRFVQYLAEAIAGEKAPDILLLLMLYRIPEFLLVIVPLAFFLAVILAFGRMYGDNEMVVLMSAGYSQSRLLMNVMGIAALITVLMAVLAFYLAPMGLKESEQISLAQDELTEVDLIVAGQFQTFGGGERVTYAERILSASGGERELANVFVALTPAGQASGEPPRIILADSARPEIDEATGARFMRLENVLQYDGTPGSGGFRVGQFDAQAIRLPPPPEFDEVLEESTLSTWSLLYSDDIAHRAELQWRISVLLLIPVIALIAVPMSRVSPRQGRFTKLLPAVLVYIGYFIALEFCRDRMADGDLSPAFGLWWVHGLFAAAGTVLFRADPEGFRLRLPQSA